MHRLRLLLLAVPILLMTIVAPAKAVEVRAMSQLEASPRPAVFAVVLMERQAGMGSLDKP